MLSTRWIRPNWNGINQDQRYNWSFPTLCRKKDILYVIWKRQLLYMAWIGIQIFLISYVKIAWAHQGDKNQWSHQIPSVSQRLSGLNNLEYTLFTFSSMKWFRTAILEYSMIKKWWQGQGMYKNRVRNDRKFFEVPALLFYE